MSEDLYNKLALAEPHLELPPYAFMTSDEKASVERLSVKELIVRRSAAMLAEDSVHWRTWLLPELVFSELPF
jgi:hypothetical protein